MDSLSTTSWMRVLLGDTFAGAPVTSYRREELVQELLTEIRWKVSRRMVKGL